jgi:hypothetical protein
MKIHTKYTLYFLLISLTTAYCNQYSKWLTLPPAATHQWRQSDGEALAYHYAQNPDISNPQVFNLSYTGDAHAVGELPILYWISGAITRYIGAPAYPLRWLSLLWMMAGFWTFGWMILQQSKAPFLSALSAGLLMTSPIVGYYGVSFLPDMPAFCIILMMSASLWQAETRQKMTWLWVAAVLAALGILLKMSLAILPIALALTWVIGNDKQIWPKESIWDKKELFGAIAMVFLAVLMGRWWISDYNAQHHATYFFADIRPIWKYDLSAIGLILAGIIGFGLPAFASIGLYLAVFRSIGFCQKNWQNLSFFGQKTLLFTILGCFCYLLLWFRMLKEHDYYWVCLLVFPALLLFLSIPFALKNLTPKTVINSLLVCWTIGIVHSALIINNRFTHRNTFSTTKNLPPNAFLDDNQISAFDIPTTARFLCPEDPSPNSSLLALKRQGWTAYNFGDRVTRDTLYKYMTNKGLTHLALRDTSVYNAMYQQFFPKKEVFLSGWSIYSCDSAQFKQDSSLEIEHQKPTPKPILKTLLQNRQNNPRTRRNCHFHWHKISIFCLIYIHKLLWIAVSQRKPRALHLHH